MIFAIVEISSVHDYTTIDWIEGWGLVDGGIHEIEAMDTKDKIEILHSLSSTISQRSRAQKRRNSFPMPLTPLHHLSKNLHFLVVVIPQQLILIRINNGIPSTPRKIASLRVSPPTTKHARNASPRTSQQ